MYKYRIDDATTKKVASIATKNSHNEKVDKLIDELKSYSNIFDYSSSPELEKVEFERLDDVVIDEEKIKKQAENELVDYKNSSIQNIIDDTSSKVEKLEEDKVNSKKNYKEAIAETKSYYGKVKEDASNDILKRGLSRSSIAINVMDAFNKEELNRYDKLNNDLTYTINSIDEEITTLNAKQQEALNNFDITYAVKLQDKINSLTNELLDKQEEVLKYNNEIAEKEAEYNKKYAELEEEIKNSNFDKEQDLMEYAGKYGVNMIQKYKETQIYNKAVSYLDSMDKNIALNELMNNATLRDLLGSSNVSKLIEKYSK